MEDIGDAALGLIQVAALALLVPSLHERDVKTSRWAGPVMGGSPMGFVLVAAVLFLIRYGLSWRA